MAAPRFFLRRVGAGWSLIELTIVLAIAAVLIFFAVRSFLPQDAVALQQAERLRNDIRHIQMLALTWGRPLRLVTGGNTYQVCCLDAAMAACLTTPPAPPAPCAVPDPVVNPATGKPFAVVLESGLSFAAAGALNFDSLGRPRNGGALIGANATITINGGSSARTVVVAPVTGFATAQ